MFSFLHTADLHLDSPLLKLARYEGAPAEALRGATRRALENLVSLALWKKVDFVLVCGDLFDDDWRDYNTGLYFVRQMARLREAGIPVFLIMGNHDAASRITRTLRYPENVRTLSTEAPETITLDAIGVAVHGQGYGSPAVEQDLSRGYPRPSPGYFNIGMLHTSATGREGHAPYAPCRIEDLVAKGYDYWALGHIHQREILRNRPAIVFPGNIQGRHIRECGPKGCVLVEVDDHGEPEMGFRPLDAFRWARVPVTVAGAETPLDVVDAACEEIRGVLAGCDGLPAAVRLEVSGPTPAHGKLKADPEHWLNQVRAAAGLDFGGRVWVEKVVFDTRAPADLRDPALLDGPMGEIVSLFQDLAGDPDLRRDLSRTLDDLWKKLPRELREGSDSLRHGEDGWLKTVLEEVRPLLIDRLLSRERP